MGGGGSTVARYVNKLYDHGQFCNVLSVTLLILPCQSISPGLVKTEFRGRLEKRIDPNTAWEGVEGVGGAPVSVCSPFDLRS